MSHVEPATRQSRPRPKKPSGAASLCLTVAGMCVYFHGAERIRLEPPKGRHTMFLRASPHDGPCIETIDIEVLAGKVPRPDLLEPVFTTGDGWSMHRDASRYVIHPGPSRPNEGSLWTLTTDLGFRRGRVYCSDALLELAGRVTLARHVVQYPLDQLLIIHMAAARSAALLVHAAGARLGAQGIVFAGPSGAGKSTVTRLLGGDGIMPSSRFLSDDRVVLRRFGSRLSVFGTPWHGDAGAALNESTTLGAVCFLRHADRTALRALGHDEALERLLPVASVPWYHPELAAKTLDLCEFLLANYPVYELAFRPSADELADVLSESLLEP